MLLFSGHGEFETGLFGYQIVNFDHQLNLTLFINHIRTLTVYYNFVCYIACKESHKGRAKTFENSMSETYKTVINLWSFSGYMSGVKVMVFF